MLHCLLGLFSFLKYVNAANPEELESANTCKHTHNGKSAFPLALMQVPWFQLDPSGCPAGPYQPLPTPYSPCFDVRKRFWGVSFNYSF